MRLPWPQLHWKRPEFLNAEVAELKLSVVLKLLGQNIYGLYEPIILYQILGQQIEHVILFYACYTGFSALFFHLGGKILSRFGLRFSLIVSTFFLAAGLAELAYMTSLNLSIDKNASEAIMWVIIFGLTFCSYRFIYWPAYHTDISLYMNKKNKGSNVGILNLINSISSIIGPLIGGYIILFYDMNTLVTTAVIGVVISIIPLLGVPNVKPTMAFSWWGMYKEMLSLHHWKTYISFLSEGIAAWMGVFWGLFVFVTLESTLELGYISAGTALVSAIIGYIIGRKIDSKTVNRRSFLTAGTVISALGWLVKGLFINPILLFVTDNVQRFGYTLQIIPYQTKMYKRFQEKLNYADEYVIIRESMVNIGAALALGLVAGALFIFDFTYIGFILAALGTLGYLFI